MHIVDPYSVAIDIEGSRAGSEMGDEECFNSSESDPEWDPMVEEEGIYQ